MREYRKQKVWQSAHELVLGVFAATKKFPREELMGLTNHMRWAATSIALGIVEGCSRGTDDEFARQLQSANAFANELEYYLLLSKDLGFLESSDGKELSTLLDDIKEQFVALIQRYSSERAAKRTNFPF